MDPVTGGLLVGSLAMSAYSAFGKKKGPDYSGVKNQFEARNSQISAFAQSLASARAKYMTSLKSMYDNAYSRFSGNAEAGFASRGMSVSGGAFASTLARETGRMQQEGDVLAADMERDDLRSVDNAYGANSNGYMSAISSGPTAQYTGDRADTAGFASALGSAASVYSNAGGAGSAGAKKPTNWWEADTRTAQAGRERANALQLESTYFSGGRVR